MREFFDPGLFFLATMGLTASLLTAWTVRGPHELREGGPSDTIQFFGIMMLSGLAAYGLTGHLAGTMFATCLAALFSLGLKSRLPRLTMAGAIEMASSPLMLLISAPWSFFLLRDLGFPRWALILCLIAIAVSVVALGFSFAEKLARQALLTHRTWRRPTRPLEKSAGARRPKISIHLPCYSEPPEVVIATIDHLARLDYPDFEVLVCDNNTEDEALWRPLAEHCARLNRKAGAEKFRFFHVSPLAGAKAGALNFLLTRMAPDAELVAVIDADYFAEPDFLSRLAGFFDDPGIGYLQTPHDYRAFEDNAYLRTCYWEYMPTNKVDMAGISEYDSAFTIGTMCLIRTRALNEAGGWAEWCLTEDSEVSIRLRALGYEGIYLRDTFGRGLIPETFDDYKKQRFRWTAGPVQQLRRYWRLFLPSPFGAQSSMRGWSKLLEAQRSMAPLQQLFGTAAAVIAGGAIAILTLAGVLPRIVLPDVAWISAGIAAIAALVSKWQRYRLSGCTRWIDMLGGEIARMSLTYVMMLASVAGLSRRPLAWRRTPKFKVESSGLGALYATLPETCIGLAHLAFLYFPISMGAELGWHFVVLAGIGIVLSALRFLSAPAMAWLCERRLGAGAFELQPMSEGFTGAVQRL